MTTTDRIVVGLLKPINPYGASLLGYLTLLWGIWIVNPLWHVFDSSRVYNKALELAPEWAWGTWAVVCGLGLIAAVHMRSTRLLACTSGFAIWHWGIVSVMMWWANWHDTAGLVYMFIALYSIFVFLNIKVNYVNRGVYKF